MLLASSFYQTVTNNEKTDVPSAQVARIFQIISPFLCMCRAQSSTALVLNTGISKCCYNKKWVFLNKRNFCIDKYESNLLINSLMTLLVAFLFKIVQTKSVLPAQWSEYLLFFFVSSLGSQNLFSA